MRYINIFWWLFVLRPLDLLARLARKPPVAGSILAVYPSRIGDFVLWLDAARGLRELYPSPRFKITLLADSAFASIAKRQSNFDAVWELNRGRYFRNPLYRLRLGWRIAAGRFALVLNPGPWPDQYHVDSLVRVTGASERIGWELTAKSGSWGVRLMRSWRSRQYTRLVPKPSEQMGMLRFNAIFLRALGHGSFAPEPPLLEIYNTRSLLTPEKPFYVLCPGAADAIKRWPTANYARVAEALFAASGMVGVVSGVGSEAALARELCDISRVPLLNLAGKLGLEEFASLLAAAKLVVSNDSAPAHIAAALGAPSLCIVGGGTFGWCMPYDVAPRNGRPLPRTVHHWMDCYGCGWRCVYKIAPGCPAPCLTNVSVEDAIGAALATLDSTWLAHRRRDAADPEARRG